MSQYRKSNKKLYVAFIDFHKAFDKVWRAALLLKLMKLGIGGVVTFKNGKIDTFLHEIDLRHIVLETDSPYLSPVPYRGKRNESANLSLINEKVASVYGISSEAVARITTENSKEIFGI